MKSSKKATIRTWLFRVFAILLAILLVVGPVIYAFIN